MSEKTYKYDAFISYSHGGIDQFVAENLHKKMETFKLPKNIKNKTNGRTKISRVFRDQEELPLASNLGDPIRDALESSEWLVVICSPRLRESKWCQTEIETFISMHGIDKVLAVLVEGEPSDSFPEQLLYKTEEVIDENGEKRTIKRAVEPLAADVRGANNKEVLKAMNLEMLRLLAPMFGVSFDDLRQRHRERKMRRNMMIASIIAGVAVAFGAVSSTLAIQINSQKNEIAKQNEVITASNIEIQNQANEIREKNDALAHDQAYLLATESENAYNKGQIELAKDLAVTSLTEMEGIKMPYTAEAQLALTTALNPYATGQEFLPAYTIQTEGTVEEIFATQDGNYIAAIDKCGKLFITDSTTGLIIDVVDTGKAGVYFDGGVAICDDDTILYIDKDHVLRKYTISSKTDEAVSSSLGKAGFVYAHPSLEHIWVTLENKIAAIDKDGVTVYEIATDDDYAMANIMAVSADEKYVSYYTTTIGDESLHIIDVTTGNDTSVTGNYVYDTVIISGSRAYVLANVNDRDYHNYTCYVICMDLKNGEEKWRYAADTVGSSIKIASYEGSDTMLFTGASYIITINQKNGKMIDKFPINSGRVTDCSYQGSSMFSVLKRNGQMENVIPEMRTTSLSQVFNSLTKDIANGKIFKGGMATADYEASYVIVYKLLESDKMTEWDGEYLSPSQEYASLSAGVSLAETSGVHDSHLIKGVLTVPNEEKVFITYQNGLLEVFNKDMTEVEHTVKGISEVSRYLGRDKTDNIYLTDYNICYILNSEYELIGKCKNVVGIAPDGEHLIVSGSNQQYSVPIFSIDELIEMAK